MKKFFFIFVLFYSFFIHAHYLYIDESLVLNGFDINNQSIQPHTICVIENNILSSYTSNLSIQSRFKYDAGLVDKNKAFSHPLPLHAIEIIEIILTINPNTFFFISDHPEHIIDHSIKIINMSCGVLNDNYLFQGKTEKEIAKIYLSDSINLKEEFEKISCQKGVDEYFIHKHLEIIIKIFQEGKKHNFNVEYVIKNIREKLTALYCEQQAYFNQFLRKEFFICQALCNDAAIGPLSPSTNSFNFDIQEKVKFKKNIIFARNFYYSASSPSHYHIPPSQIPGQKFADRTLCVVTGVTRYMEKYEDYSVSTNSHAAPVISACASYIDVTLQHSGINLKPHEIAEAMLKTANRIYKDEGDKIEINGEIYSKSYGAGLLNAQAAIDYAIKKFTL